MANDSVQELHKMKNRKVHLPKYHYAACSYVAPHFDQDILRYLELIEQLLTLL
jgi:hypothetical protein